MIFRTGHPVRGKVVVNDLILKVNGGHVLRVGHSDRQQDTHQQVNHLNPGRKNNFRKGPIEINALIVFT